MHERGYDEPVDYWALGVLAFEMVDGKTPFFHLKKFCCGRIIHKAAEPRQRLGNGKGGVEAINDHRFFAGYTYIRLASRSKLKIMRIPTRATWENAFRGG